MINDFATLYAIHIPGGDLYEKPRNVGGWMLFNRDDEPSEPLTFGNREDADRVLTVLKNEAASLGMDNWCGQVVQALRTPFMVTDPGVQFAEQVQAWMEGGTAR